MGRQGQAGWGGRVTKGRGEDKLIPGLVKVPAWAANPVQGEQPFPPFGTGSGEPSFREEPFPMGHPPTPKGLGKPSLELLLPGEIRSTPGSSAHPCLSRGTVSGSGRREGRVVECAQKPCNN